MKTVAAFGLSLLVAGCVNLNPYQQPLKVEAGPEPTKAELEPIALHVLQGLLKDPDSVKQFRIISVMKARWFLGAPVSNPGAAEGWLACFEYNAKNSYGGYVGVRPDGFVFQTAPGQPPNFLMTQSNAGFIRPRCTP